MSGERRRRPVERWQDGIRQSGLPATTRHVALALSEYMDFATLGKAFPGPARLAKETGYAASTIKRHLKLLQEKGWLAQTFKGGDWSASGRRTASAYRGCFPKGQVRPVSEKDGSRARPVSEKAPTRVTDDTDPCQSETPPRSLPGSGPAGGGSAAAAPASPLRPKGRALLDIFGRKPQHGEVMALWHFVDEFEDELLLDEWPRVFDGMKQADIDGPDDVRYAATTWLKEVIRKRGTEQMWAEVDELLDVRAPEPHASAP